jgi:predicted RNase H-like nuclease
MKLNRTLTEVQAFAPQEHPVFIDMPIGFIRDGEVGRACDTLARRYLSPLRHSSVFTPPCRAAVYADMATASAVNYSLTGKKLSQQSLNIIPKIRMLDEFLQEQTAVEQKRWYEAHPEVVFAAFHGAQPLEHRKKTAEGEAQRLALLKPFFPGVDAWYKSVRNQFLRKEVLPDDILDALGLAIANHLTLTKQAVLQTLPADVPFDETGLPMQIAFSEPILR